MLISSKLVNIFRLEIRMHCADPRCAERCLVGISDRQLRCVAGGPTARGDRIRAKFYYNKGMISQKLGEAIIKECGPLEYQPELAGGWANPSAACSAALGALPSGACAFFPRLSWCCCLPDPCRTPWRVDGR